MYERKMKICDFWYDSKKKKKKKILQHIFNNIPNIATKVIFHLKKIIVEHFFFWQQIFSVKTNKNLNFMCSFVTWNGKNDSLYLK